MTSAVPALSALAHEGRLSIFRLLVQAGPKGLAAGEIARATGVLPNTLSSNLNILAAAGLVTSHRLRGNDVPDVYLAAVALEYGATMVTRDRGFVRYGLPLLDPLA